MTLTTIHTLKVIGPLQKIHQFYNTFNTESEQPFKTSYISETFEKLEQTYNNLLQLKNTGEILDFSLVDDVIVPDNHFSFFIIEKDTSSEGTLSLSNFLPVPLEIINDKTNLATNYQQWFMEQFGVSDDIHFSDTLDSHSFTNEQGEQMMELFIIFETGIGNLTPLLNELILRYHDFTFYSTYQSVESSYAGVIYQDPHTYRHHFFNDTSTQNINYRNYLLENTQLPITTCSNCHAQIISIYDDLICPNCGTIFS